MQGDELLEQVEFVPWQLVAGIWIASCEGIDQGELLPDGAEERTTSDRKSPHAGSVKMRATATGRDLAWSSSHGWRLRPGT